MSQNRDDLPYFPLYASNIVADKRYRLMSAIERAIWISVLLECWPNGSVPADPVELAKYLGFPVEDVKAGLTERVLSFFKEVNGELISPFLEKYWGEVLARRAKQSEGGKKGANKRYNKDLKDVSQPIGQPMSQGIGQPIGSLNTIKSNTLKSNSVSRKESIPDPDLDEWVRDYDNAEAAEATEAKRARVRVRV